MNKTLTMSGAVFMLFSIGCDISDPPEGDASVGHDSQLVMGGTIAVGGSPGAGGASTSTGGTLGTGGQGSGGLVGSGGAAIGGNHGGGGSGGDSGKVCGGIAGLNCPKEKFCEYPLGECSSIADGTGICMTLPEACPEIYQPVCGCDGKTYGNDCERRAAGIPKLSNGMCSTNGKMCGDIAGFACSKGQFCDLAPGDCGKIADGAGTCAPTGVGIACNKIYQPVCGCDGRTYGNDCERQVAGVSKLANGPCVTIGKMCGGIAGFACSKGQFCDLAPGDCGKIADGAGTCALTGKEIACILIYQPVCGCDGKTYGNDCARRAAGVSKSHDDACTAKDGGTTLDGQ